AVPKRGPRLSFSSLHLPKKPSTLDCRRGSTCRHFLSFLLADAEEKSAILPFCFFFCLASAPQKITDDAVLPCALTCLEPRPLCRCASLCLCPWLITGFHHNN